MYDENEHTTSVGRDSPVTGDGAEILSVSELNERAKRLLERSFQEIWLEGEISRPTVAASGACFRSQLARSRCKPEAGIKVLARGRVSIYPAQGRYQFIVSYMEDAGEGALQRKFDALKKKLFDEGLFDSQHKKPLPILPRRVGLITSETGAVIHDMISTFRKRFPAIALRLYPVSVQGAGAVKEIVHAIELADRRQDCDALILARGGGSLEDLMAFNDERVARSVFACSIPLVCGVGHEPDVSIADFVADHRAATPTAAAEALSPDQNEWLACFRGFGARLSMIMRDRLQVESQRIDLTGKRLVHPKARLRELNRRLAEQQVRLQRTLRSELKTRHDSVRAFRRQLTANAPDRKIRRTRQELERLTTQLGRRTRARLDYNEKHLGAIVARLQTVSPLATLDRGYAILERPGSRTGSDQIIRASTEVERDEVLRARLARGQLDVRVVDVIDVNEPQADENQENRQD